MFVKLHQNVLISNDFFYQSWLNQFCGIVKVYFDEQKMKIIQNILTDKLKNIVYSGFEKHAINEIGASEIEKPISFYFEDCDKNIIAAVVCQSFWGALHIKYVWTHESHRFQGLASQLMQEVFSFAKKGNYPFAFVETMSFQAPNFYKKLGFKTEFIRNGYSHGVSFYYMKKDF